MKYLQNFINDKAKSKGFLSSEPEFPASWDADNSNFTTYIGNIMGPYTYLLSHLT